LDLLSKKQPFISPYTFVNNNPIFIIDPDGEDDYDNADGSYNAKFIINKKG
jgi:hypothetical protein